MVRRTAGWIIPASALLFTVFVSLVSSPASYATIANGSFEANFTGWTSTGDASIQTQPSSGVTPTNGVNEALITTINTVNDGGTLLGTSAVSAGVLETFLGVAPGTLTGQSATEGSGFRQVGISGNAGDTIAFDWDFLTDDSPGTLNNDFAFYVLDGTATTITSINTSTFGAPNALFGDSTGYQPLSFVLGSSGVHTLGFGVVDVGDFQVNSGLLVDNVTQTPAVVVGGATPEPGTLAMMATGIAGLLARRRRRAAGNI